MSEGGVVLADSRWPVTMESRYAIVIRDRGLQTAGRACLSDVRAAAPCLHPTTAATKAEKRRRGRPRMRPGAKRRDQPFGQQYLAPDCGLASMRPDANRRDHVRVLPPADHKATHDGASMRPDANRRDHAFGTVAVPPWLARASMRPDAKRRDHVAGNWTPRRAQLASMRPGANAGINLWATVPCSRLRTRFNEARREAPGSHAYPGAPWSRGQASMRPGAKRRDHGPYNVHVRYTVACFNEARREAPGSQGRIAVWHEADPHASMRPGAKRRDHGPDTGCHTISSCAALCERSPNVLAATPEGAAEP